MEPPQALQDLDLTTLVGLPVEEAREIVERAGGSLRAVAPGGVLTQDLRSNRVTVLVRDGVVIEHRGIG